jgi:hypothetical protein
MSMFRTIILGLIAATVVWGCAGRSPISPGNGLISQVSANAPGYDGPHRLWLEYQFYIDASHTQIDAVPKRNSRLHLNVPKFLEQYCTNCLEITGLHNNGDSTIDFTVEITHPFPGHPEYTGFDVKGILMFRGSHEIPENLYKLPLYPENFRLSWRLMNDPELLNADGYTYYWSPWYDSGSDMPIFNYYQGKYASGTPTANINGFLYFYSNETRQMFEEGKSVSRTYHIWLPSGPVEAGYAVDACWEPPDKTPVTDPAVDFPISANQPEATHFKCVINDGNPVTPGWAPDPLTVHKARAEITIRYWFGHPEAPPIICDGGAWNEVIELQKLGFILGCAEPPENPDWHCIYDYFYPVPPDGVYQLFAYEWHIPVDPEEYPYKLPFPDVDVFEVTFDME